MANETHKALKYDYKDINEAIAKTKNLPINEYGERKNADEKLQNQIDTITGGDTDASLSSLKTEITDLKAGSDETIKSLDTKIEEIDARSDVVDVVGTYAELKSYPRKLTKDDVVKVLNDESRNKITSYYRYPEAAKKGEVDPSKWEFVGAITQYALQSALNTEKSDRQAADTTLTNSIDAEVTARKNTDTNLSTHTSNTSNPHSVTKAQVGLGSVYNTEDSATPTENGTTKFTTGGAYSLKTSLQSEIEKKVTANSTITATTGAVKVDYDEKGLITGSSTLSADDIPDLDAGKVTSGTFADERIASASTWTAKQDAIEDLSTIRSNAEAGKAASDNLNGHTVSSDVPADAKFSDTTYSAVTDSANGLMRSTQKKKLDTIAEGAEVNVQSDWSTTDTSADSFIKNKPELSISDNQITIGTDSIKVSFSDHIHDIAIDELAGDAEDISLESGKSYKLGICDWESSIAFKMPASTIAAATAVDLGAIKTGFTTASSNRNYAVTLDSSSKAYVNVPYKDYNGSDFINVSSTGTYTAKISKGREYESWEYNDSSGSPNEDDYLWYYLDTFDKTTFTDYPINPSTEITCYHVVGDLFLEDLGSVCSDTELTISNLLRFLLKWPTDLTFSKIAGTLIYHQEPSFEIEDSSGHYIYCYKLFGERDHILDVPYHIYATNSSGTWSLYSYYQSYLNGSVTSSGKMDLTKFMTFDTAVKNQTISFWISFDLYIYGK